MGHQIVDAFPRVLSGGGREGYTCLMAEGLYGTGCEPLWTEMPCEGTRLACSWFSLLLSAFGGGEKAVGEITKSIEVRSLILAQIDEECKPKEMQQI